MWNVIVGLVASWALFAMNVTEAAAPAGASTPSITAQSLGPLSGDNQSGAFGVSDAGSVVGSSGTAESERAFYWSKTKGLVRLSTTGTTGAAYAIAGKAGSVEYAVGYEESGGHARAVIWVAPPSLSPVPLSGSGSIAFGVNDSGTAVGSSAGGVPVIWTPSGSGYTPTYIGLLPNQVEAYATDIDNDGLVVGCGYDSVTYRSRGFVRLLNGVVVALNPVSGDAESTAQTVSDKVGPTSGQFVYIAGSTTSASGVQRAVRWKVDVVAGTVLETKVLSQTWAEGVNGSGDVAGTLNGTGGKQSAKLFRNGVYVTLPPPKGATGGTSRGMARTAASPTYVVGQTMVNNRPRAVVWRVQ